MAIGPKSKMFLLRKKSASHSSGIRLEIILYHFVSDKRNDFTLSGHTVTTADFRRQLEYLSAHYAVIPLREAAALPTMEADPTRPYAAVCFDDGYRCILKEAYPILRDMRIPATMFINPPVLGNRDLLWRDKIRYLMRKGLEEEFVAFLRERGGPYKFGMLKDLGFYKWSKNPNALRGMKIQEDVNLFFGRKRIDPAAIALKNDLFMEEKNVVPRKFLDFGNHTWSHPILTLLPAKSQKEEIVKGHDYLKSRGIAPLGLALPFSPYNNDTLSVCRELGYEYILTVFEESNFLSPTTDRPVILHRRMAPKNAGGFVSIV
jgi:peptidoglycan/xylan/chitin deacetylase (PgdA/CDA1 family)